MATPTAAHARMAAACPEQKNPDAKQEGEGLKNGTTSLEDSDDSTGTVLVKNRVRSPGGSHRDMAMDGFQDGGQQPNSRLASATNAEGYPGAMERPRMEYGQPPFGSGPPREGSGDDFRNNSQEAYNCEIAPAYGRGSYSDQQQHGGPGNVSEMTTNSQPNKMYPQYNQPQMRPQYPRGMGPQQRAPGMGGSYPGGGGNNSQQQRFLSGPSLSQQTGPTPTLNQLLQAPNSLQRYHNNYDYNTSQKNMGEASAPHYQGPNNSWGNMRGPSSYPQQMSSSMYRNQIKADLR